MAGGFGAETNTLFQEAVEGLMDSECSVVRHGAPESVGRFQWTQDDEIVYPIVPCTVQHNVGNAGAMAIQYANRLQGRAVAIAYVPRQFTILVDDVLKVAGGDTYDVVGSPHLDGPDDPCLTVPVAAIAPVVTNP